MSRYIGCLLLLFAVNSQAALSTFNSPSAAAAADTRDAWLNAIGITEPEFLIDFETGFTDGQNISGDSLVAGLVITDTSPAGAAIVSDSASDFGSSSPVGTFALAHNERAYLEFDFSASPVDYFGFRDIDQSSTSGIVTFVGGATEGISFETTATSGFSAEFFGLYRNDMPKIILVQLDANGDGEWGVDNLEFGSVVVPLPGAVYLLGSALLTFAFGAKRRPLARTR